VHVSRLTLRVERETAFRENLLLPKRIRLLRRTISPDRFDLQRQLLRVEAEIKLILMVILFSKLSYKIKKKEQALLKSVFFMYL
jgi:predicted transcriptional regulator